MDFRAFFIGLNVMEVVESVSKSTKINLCTDS